jgi:hypothetical protein
MKETHADFHHTETLWTGTPLTSTLLCGKLIVSGLMELVAYIDEPTFLARGMVPKYPLVKLDPRSKEQRPYMASWCKFDQGPPPLDTEIWVLCIVIERRQKRFNSPELGDGYEVLLLTCTNTESGEYCRIGVGMIETMPGTFGGPEKATITIV